MAGCGVVVGEVTVTSSSARSGSGCEVTSLCSRAGEIAGGDASTTVGVTLQDAQVAVAAITPAAALGASATGPLRFRPVQGDIAGDWQPLATLARVPTLTGLTCTDSCTLTGRDLFLLAAVGDRPVPEGFTGDRLAFPPPPSGGAIPARLRDAPDVTATLARPGATP